MKKRIKYEVGEVQNKLFDPGEEYVIPRDKTITIKLLYDERTIEIKEYGYVTPEEVYEQIIKGEDINLNKCYIKDFSSRKYSKIFHKKCMLRNFSAIDSFFDCNKKIEFFKTHFDDGYINFSETRFNDGNVDFSGAQFRKGSLIFEGTQFGDGDVNFNGVKFDDVSVDFLLTKFCSGDVDFRKAQFNKGTVNFICTSFGDGNVNFNGTHFSDVNISFCGTYFGKGNTYFVKTYFGDGNVDFSETRFDEGNIRFAAAQFGEGIINFREVIFGQGILSFRKTQFGKGDVIFEGAQLGKGDVIFEGAQFGKGDINFHRVNFNDGDVNFKRTKFDDGNITFSEAQFGDGEIDFFLTQFGDADIFFCRTRFGDGVVRFNDSKFGKGVVYFRLAKFGNGIILFGGALFGDGEIDFKGSEVDTIDFKVNNLKNPVRLVFKSCNSISFSKVNIYDILTISNIKKCITFTDVHIFGKMEIDWDENNLDILINNQTDTTLKEKAYQFRMLKENYRNLGWYDEEDKAYVEFKKCMLKHEQEEAYKAPLLLIFPKLCINRIKKFIQQDIGLFGTSPKRVIATMFFSVSFFSLIYFFLQLLNYPILHGDVLKNINIFGKFKYSIYHSVVTFLTIGYGDIQPCNTLGIILSGIEGFIGLFLMAYFTVAFVRKILR